MTLNQLIQKLNLKICCGEEYIHKEIKGCYVSDLLSDVISSAKKDFIWITIHIHKNIVAVATMKKLSAIIIVKNNKPDKETIEAAIEQKIPILISDDDTFITAGNIFNLIK